MIEDLREVAERALRVATEQKMIASDGTVIDLEAQTLCVHGHTPTALDLVRSIRETSTDEGVEVKPMAAFMAQEMRNPFS